MLCATGVGRVAKTIRNVHTNNSRVWPAVSSTNRANATMASSQIPYPESHIATVNAGTTRHPKRRYARSITRSAWATAVPMF